MSSTRHPGLTYRGRTLGEVMLFAEAWLSLALASLAVKLRPFEALVRARNSVRAELAEGVALDQLVWAISAAQRRSWLRAKCMESALALRAILHRRGGTATLHYGIRNAADEGLQAHVWLSVGGEIVIGGDVAALFTEVAAFEERAAA